MYNQHSGAGASSGFVSPMCKTLPYMYSITVGAKKVIRNAFLLSLAELSACRYKVGGIFPLLDCNYTKLDINLTIITIYERSHSHC